MSVVAAILIWTAIGLVVSFAVYRQVRAHVELRRSVRELEAKHRLLMERLEPAVRSLQRKGPHDTTSLLSGLSGFPGRAERRGLETWAQFLSASSGRRFVECHVLLDDVAIDAAQPLLEKLLEGALHTRSSEELIRSWQEEEEQEYFPTSPTGALPHSALHRRSA